MPDIPFLACQGFKKSFDLQAMRRKGDLRSRAFCTLRRTIHLGVRARSLGIDDDESGFANEHTPGEESFASRYKTRATDDPLCALPRPRRFLPHRLGHGLEVEAPLETLTCQQLRDFFDELATNISRLRR